MHGIKTESLSNAEVANTFYEDRYQDGYMDEWPEEKKLRVIEVIRSLPLANDGQALDFGCGNGVFTEVLKRALPNWQITGCDISPTALENARKRYPNLRFDSFESLENQGLCFDLVFSHHVLEHVFDIRAILQSLAKRVKPGGRMLHIMPCGNPGSLEFQLASSIQNGIDPQLGNRFYFEDVGHLRRLSSAELNQMLAELGFKPEKAWFANQHYGALQWMSDYPEDFITTELTPAEKAASPEAKRKLMELRKQLLQLKRDRVLAKEGTKHRIKLNLQQTLSRPLSAFTLPLRLWNDIASVRRGQQFSQQLSNEWPHHSNDERGSEMFLSYVLQG